MRFPASVRRLVVGPELDIYRRDRAVNQQQRVYIDGRIYVARGNGYVRVK
ncbi:hypothetical protein SEA_XIANYUE_92 [Mycobacterium phage XianYue]|nr:hypothetical protein SEA_XIANYUE_92 [Mycobacterium phage XianYue]